MRSFGAPWRLNGLSQIWLQFNTASLEGLTLHGLLSSFKSLTEWLEAPVGVVAKIQGHKPSATAKKHYTVRPMELLRFTMKKSKRGY